MSGDVSGGGVVGAPPEQLGKLQQNLSLLNSGYYGDDPRGRQLMEAQVSDELDALGLPGSFDYATAGPQPHVFPSYAQIMTYAAAGVSGPNEPTMAGAAVNWWDEAIGAVLQACGPPLDAVGLMVTAAGGASAIFTRPSNGLVSLPGYTAPVQGGDMNGQQFNALSGALSALASSVSGLGPSAGEVFAFPFGDTLVTAGTEIMSSLQRYQYNPNFLMYMFGSTQSDPGGVVGIYSFAGASMADNLPGETDLDMLNRVYPQSSSWMQSSGYWGGRPYWQDSAELEYGAVFVYCPSASADAGAVGATSLVHQFFHLWDYTPNSGGPMRNGITDFMLVLSMLPIQF